MTNEEIEEPKEPRAEKCETCGYPLTGQFNPNDTSTWRTDNFCSARCKRNADAKFFLEVRDLLK